MLNKCRERGYWIEGFHTRLQTFVRLRYIPEKIVPLQKSETKIRMKKTVFYLFIALFIGCTSARRPADNTFFVSILPLRTLITGIVGDDFPVEVLVPSGASPETFEPSARQFAALNRAQLIFNVGLIDFERTLLSKVSAPEKVVNLSEGIETIAGTCSHGGHHAHTHGVDPHVWTSPRALQQMASNAYKTVHRLYPDSVKYTNNYQKLISELQELDRQTAAQIGASGVSYFLIYHPALTYYARDYGLQQLAVEQEGKEPSAKRLATIIREARADSVKRIFYQRQFPRSTVETIARDMGAEAVEIDPLREDVIDNIRQITGLITTER